MNFTPEQKLLRRRILEISHEARVSHLGSAFSVVDLIAAIYHVKKPDERFVLSAGHSAAALYVVLEQHGLLPNPDLHELNVHPDRNPAIGIDVSTGSLGQGLPIALGIALVDRSKKAWVVTTDGEMAEGSMWEALRIASEQKLSNLRLFVNANGFGAYDRVETDVLTARIKAFGWRIIPAEGHSPDDLQRAIVEADAVKNIPAAIIARTTSEQFPFLTGLDAHYYTMKQEDFDSAMAALTTV